MKTNWRHAEEMYPGCSAQWDLFSSGRTGVELLTKLIVINDKYLLMINSECTDDTPLCFCGRAVYDHHNQGWYLWHMKSKRSPWPGEASRQVAYPP